MKFLKIKRLCPNCNRNLQRKGVYYRRRKPYWVKRYFCINCKKSFNELNISNIKKTRNLGSPQNWKPKTFTDVKKLINKKMIPPFKQDHRKNKTYPSSRMIVTIMFDRYGKKVNKTIVSQLIKKYRVDV
ncbi:hypothetical protein LCGC14_1060520 [marine sediment metagenome]|uniref:Uncharacterized protein n=1 Tax=marine sediment metagenome TaxID=412755 RepID=A0A0F9QS30_9ZZZZ